MCGIAVAYFFDHQEKAAERVRQMLISQSNRMNYSAGIVTYNEKRENDNLIIGDWGLGPIDTAFGLDSRPRMNKLEGYLALGQGRYATSNSNQTFEERQRLAMAQPYINNEDICFLF